MPPPIPVTMPSSAAITGFRPKASAFWVPETANSASPAASNKKDGVVPPVDAGKPAEGEHARQKGDGKISPVTDRCWRNRANHQIARDTSEVSGHERQHQNTEQVEPALDGSGGPAKREDKGPDEVEHQKQHVHRGRPPHAR